MIEYMTTIEKVINGDYVPYYSTIKYKDIIIQFGTNLTNDIKMSVLGGTDGKRATVNIMMNIQYLRQLPDPLAIIHQQFMISYKELESRTP